MTHKEAKKRLRSGADYYLRQRRVIGTHFSEWKAVDQLLNRLERKELALAQLKLGLKELYAKWSEDARNHRGATLGVADRIQQLIKECRGYTIHKKPVRKK